MLMFISINLLNTALNTILSQSFTRPILTTRFIKIHLNVILLVCYSNGRFEEVSSLTFFMPENFLAHSHFLEDFIILGTTFSSLIKLSLQCIHVFFRKVSFHFSGNADHMETNSLSEENETL
jgi:hypothetical protein